MTLVIPNGSFEGGGSWTFSGSAGITSYGSPNPPAAMVAHDGTNYGFVSMINTPLLDYGVMSVDFTVSPADRGYYRLDGWYAACQGSLLYDGSGAFYFKAELDGTDWIPIANSFVSGYLTWAHLTSSFRLLEAGSHILTISGCCAPFADYTGTPWELAQMFALFDGLGFVAGPIQPRVRLTCHPGRLAKCSVPSGQHQRLTVGG